MIQPLDIRLKRLLWQARALRRALRRSPYPPLESDVSLEVISRAADLEEELQELELELGALRERCGWGGAL